MSEPYFTDESVTLWHGDALAVLRELPDASVDCCVTSPPYFGLRDYGEAGQYGLEASPAEYVETMRAVFVEVRRVLADDGTLWLNLGDSYSSEPPGKSDHALRSSTLASTKRASGATAQMRESVRKAAIDRTKFLPRKNLMGMPWRVAFALQDDCWILRNDTIWHKSNAMPESTKDRLSSKHEYLFMLSKSARYWFDLDAIREPHLTPESDRGGEPVRIRDVGGRSDGFTRTSGPATFPEGGKNPGDVWTIPTQPFAEAHFAVMPQALAERAILAGCKPGGTVLDPFSGSGTTGLAATKHGRRYVGIDLNADYLDLSLRTRLGQATLMTDGEAS